MVGGEGEGEGFLSYRAVAPVLQMRLTEGEEATMDHTEPAEGDSATREGPRKRRSRAKRVLGFAAVLLVGVSAFALAPVVVGAVLGLCVGVVLLLAVSGIPPSHTFRTLQLLVVGRNRPLLPAYILLAGQLVLSALAVYQQVPAATFGAVITTICLVWLLLRPGLLAAAVLVVYGCLEVLGPGTALLRQYPEVAASGQAAWMVRAYAFHALLWVATLWLLVRGVRAIRREQSFLDSPSSVGHGEGI